MAVMGFGCLVTEKPRKRKRKERKDFGAYLKR